MQGFYGFLLLSTKKQIKKCRTFQDGCPHKAPTKNDTFLMSKIQMIKMVSSMPHTLNTLLSIIGSHKDCEKISHCPKSLPCVS